VTFGYHFEIPFFNPQNFNKNTSAIPGGTPHLYSVEHIEKFHELRQSDHKNEKPWEGIRL
jgi:hypothetical protein